MHFHFREFYAYKATWFFDYVIKSLDHVTNKKRYFSNFTSPMDTKHGRLKLMSSLYYIMKPTPTMINLLQEAYGQDSSVWYAATNHKAKFDKCLGWWIKSIISSPLRWLWPPSLTEQRFLLKGLSTKSHDWGKGRSGKARWGHATHKTQCSSASTHKVTWPLDYKFLWQIGNYIYLLLQGLWPPSLIKISFVAFSELP